MSENNLTLEPTESLEGPIRCQATIVNIQLRDVVIDGDTATYADFKFKPEHEELAQIVTDGVKAGFPLKLSPDTLLGGLVKRLGGDPTKPVDLNDFLGMTVEAIFDREPGSDGKTYWRIQRESIIRA